MVLPILFLTILSLARGESAAVDESENGLRDDKDTLAYESFGAPVYGAYPYGAYPYGGSLLGGKSAYNYPLPPATPSMPANYAGYMANPYAYGAYNRYTSLPNSVSPYMGYGGSGIPNALGYGYSTLLSRYGGFGSPYNTNSYYGADRLRYPGYTMAGLGYRYGGPAYAPPAPVKGAPAARADVPAVARAAAAAAARYAAPFAPYPVPAPLPFAGLPPPTMFAPYGGAVRPTQAKDGSLRYPNGPLEVPGVPVY